MVETSTIDSGYGQGQVPSNEKTASVVFTEEELWFMQKYIRHEVAGSNQWRNAPASHELNSQIAEALLRCDNLGLEEAHLTITMSDCLAIDFCIPQDAKTPAGIAIGKAVLLKSFRARNEIECAIPTAPASVDMTYASAQVRAQSPEGGDPWQHRP